MSDYDGLRLCPVCGDRYTTTRLCTSCAAQEMIDAEPWLDEPPMDPTDTGAISAYNAEHEIDDSDPWGPADYQ